MEKFNFTPIQKASQEILEGQRQEQQSGGVAQPIPEFNQQMQTVAQPAPNVKPKKTENGIVINVPMADYMQLTMMKIQTGRTLKDLALQAIHEFVERNAQQ